MQIKVFFQKTSLLMIAVFGLLIGVFVYATIDKTVYTTEQLIVIPDTVTSSVWSNLENALINDVPEESLYQDFNQQNSAYIDAVSIVTVPEIELAEPEASPVDVTESEAEQTDTPGTEGSEEPSGENAETNPEEAVSDETEEPSESPVETEPEVVEEPEPESATEKPETQPEPEVEQEPEPAEEASTVKLFPFAQEVITTDVNNTNDEPVPVVPEEVIEEEVQPEPESETEPEVIVEEEPVVPEEIAPVETEVEENSEEVMVNEEEVIDESGQENSGAAEENSEEVDAADENISEEEVVEEEEIIPNIEDDCIGDTECKLYSSIFSGFSMPEFESGTFLSGAQLRLSLGARTKTEDREKLQRFVVEYTYEVGTPWRTATIIDIEDETSNSINGGYFLVSLERPQAQSQLSNLQVRVSYQGDISQLERAYIESVWLEVTSATFYEETDPEYLSGAIEYGRTLEEPKFHELNNPDLDPSMSELPSFTLSYSPQQGFFRRTFNDIFSENQYLVDSVKITDSAGTVMTVPVDVIYHEDMTWTVQFLKQPQKLVPGRYQMELVINENDTLYTDTFEFYWGVLAVNTTKSMYFADEDVTLNLAALTEKGDTICDARLELKIIDPANTIYEVPVEQSGSCGKNNVTDIPDYLAYFKDAHEIGEYTIQLKHLNREGEVVHSIEDSFEVRDFIPYDIERTAPTRIYPPAPYDVSLKIKANRSYEGDIIERIPRGFVLTENSEGAEVLTMPEYTELIWRNVVLEEGDDLLLSYQFDAPDISPYMFLLGPLNMDGFTELRQWQIASDALTSIGSFSGTRTIAGTNLNQTASPMQWSTSSVDTFYYTHSTTTDSHEVTLRQTGDYFLAISVPHQRTDGNARGTRVGVEVRVNGVSVPESLGRSGYISNQNGHAESSTNAHFLLSDIVADDVLEVYVEGLTTINVADIINVTGKASMYLEYIGVGAGVFAATTTQTTNSTNLNQTTEYPFSWVESRQDSGFVHSDSVNPEQIIISNPGTYFVQVNIPITSSANNTNITGQVRLDGALVSGGQFKQGYTQAPGTESDSEGSIHWSGIVVATTTNQVLTLTALREGNAGTVTVTSGFFGSVLVREMPSTEFIALRGTAVVGGTNWNPAAAAAIQWTSRDAYDSSLFTHSTSSNSHQITIGSDGDYLLSYNDALTGGVTRANSRVTVLKNGTGISGAQTKSHFIRNQNAHSESSSALVMVVEDLLIGDVITVTVQQEGAAGTLNDSTDGQLLMWKKAEIDFRPDAPTTYNLPFDNIRFASTTPFFDFQANDPDGTSNIEYEFSISTSTGFAASTTFNSSVDSEFFNTSSSTDLSPFVENNIIRLQLSSGDALTDLTTYYWRTRARDVTGSGEYGDWSTTQSLTVDMAASAPSWFQSYSGQFEGDSLVGTVSSGADRVQVDATESSEVLIAYGEGSVTTPRYRLWNGANWGLEGSAQAVSGTINWVRTSAAVSRDEYAMVTLDSANDAYAQIYSASTSSWGNLTLLSSVVTSAAYRGVAVGYESLSGDAIAVSCSNGPNPVYRVWNGTTWSATSSITVSSANNCNFLEIASDPASDELILVVRDTGTQYEALVWDGSAWIESRVIGSSALVAREGMSVVYESSGDQAIITVSDNANPAIFYTTWNGTEFSANATQAIGDDFEFGRLTADPSSDKIALCYIDTDNDVGVLRWDGGVWSTFVELDIDGNIDTARPIECAFEIAPGRSDYLMAPYSDTGNVRYRSATSSAYSTEATIGTMQDSFWVQTARAGDGTIIIAALDDVTDDLNASAWNGSSWSTEELLETSPSSVIATPYEMYDIVSKKFEFSEGVVETPPIDFTAVPNQPTWGDVSFSTTEPFGTDVKVRIKYSNVGTCDAYISDGALSGNGAGFDVTNSPIDLTGLSTTTYDQICLEATLTTLGSESASLEEWTLAWVREPKLSQNNYRWYVNGSFLTPTDVWPVGATDLAENAPLTSVMAINADDVIRLRMSLMGENVELPAFSEAFKLQYAEGLTCSNSLVWSDVGDTSSTTALWRGFENPAVGDGWYSGSWDRRVKVTIDSGLVTGDQTNFPVYLNLDDFPDAFFSNVQVDGDDIRITESDGETELPYELVAIDTSAKTGELHFKANVSSTTDSEFFVYYGNSGASGYSVSATYGRNNVWTNGFLAVFHLDQSPTASAPQFIDSTGNNAGTAVNLEVGDRLAGVVGRAIDHDGVDEHITTNMNQNMLTSTWSIWLNADGAQGAYDGLLMSRGTLTNGMNVDSAGTRLGYHWRDAVNTYSWVGGPLYPTNQWFMASLVVQPTTATMYAHTGSGVASGTNAVTHATATIDALTIGRDPFGAARSFNGLVDEITLSNVARSATWLATTYNNKSNPTGFYGVSSEELISDGRLLPTTLLSSSDNPETYETENPTRENQNDLPVGEESEWDFVIQDNNAESNTNYCFRMVYEDGSLFNTYSNYPRLITNAPPVAPELYAPFDNERLASTTPWFEFAATDEVGDLIAYQIQVDTDVNFGTPDISTDSVSNFAAFTNLLQPTQKSEFTSGQRIRFESATALSNGNTYWWRVRGQDVSGSGEYGDWSTPYSVTINTSNTITTWFQTTGSQFATNNFVDLVTSTSSNDVGIESGFTAGTTTSSVIDYDDRTSGNAWGDFSFTHNVSSGAIRYYIEYLVAGDTYALVPDVALAGNSSGFTSSPVSLADLNTTTYNELRIVAGFTGNATLPRLLDWTVEWSETIEIPSQVQPFDNAKVATTTPALTFFSTDPENDSIEYEVQLSSSYAFTSSSTFNSGADAGFSNTITGGDTTPFNSGETIRYTLQSALTNGNTYWWRVRARDPGGANNWSEYSDPYSFTVDTAITVSMWHQTTGEQFETGVLDSIETDAGSAQITSIVNEVLMAYGEGTGQAPRYRLWNGTSWSAAGTAASVGAQIRWTELKASPTRAEYALGTVGTDNDMNVQIYDANSDSWGDVYELEDAIPDTLQRGFDLSYETTSGDLLAVSCNGVDATYAIWNGTTWSATTTINLANANNCLYIELASDPISDEIVAVFKHTNTSAVDYQILVWSGSAWGNSLALGDMAENANAGAAVVYEESGNQAIVALTNNAATTLLYALWNGSAWSTSTTPLGDHIEWASLKRDEGSDAVSLCYVDNDTNVGVIQWSGSAWGAFTEIEQIANGKAGQPVDCTYETTAGRDGYLIVPYSDATAGRYQFYATSSFNGELSLTTMQDSWRVSSLRAGDGLIHTVFFDDTNDRYDVSQWDGSTWTVLQTISTTPSITGTPFDGSYTMAARTYPNFTAGSIRSTTIDFNDGAGPRWEEVTFTDVTPGASYIEYHIYYATSSGYELIPDSALPGNSAGFTASPIDISAVDRTIYEILSLDAEFVCVSGSCPTLNDWTVEWSEGITVSGTAYDYNASTTLSSGTVGVAVNGVVQAGKTATVLGDGTWAINNVTAFEDDVVTTFMDGAVDAEESVAVTIYNGIGDVTNMQLARRHLSLGSSDSPTLTNAFLGQFDNTDDEDIFFSIDGSSVLTLCVESGCTDAKLRVLAGTTYTPSANTSLINFENYGTFSPATSTVRVRGSWTQNGTFNIGQSTVIFTATTSSSTLSASSSLGFYNLTFGETSGTATWNSSKNLDIDGALAVNFGTLARSTTSIAVAGNLSLAAGGSMSGLGTTTFDGSGSNTWSDAKATTSSSNIGYVVIDGTTKTITLAGNVGAESVTIGTDDTLNASGSGYNINVYRSWVNNNAFIPQSGTVTFVGTTTGSINRGSSSFNNLSFTGAGGNWSFSTSTLALTGNLSIATGTVTLPTGTTTIAGSFSNTGGTFLHNNGEVRMTSTAGGRTITQSGTAFLNAFYDLVFSGSGAWSFSEANASTTRNFRIQSGTVTFPAGQLTIGGDFLTTGSGAFAHNNGEVILLVSDADEVRTNGSSFNNLRVMGAAGSWYDNSWSGRVPVTIDADSVEENLTDFPVYVNLDDLPDAFFAALQADGDDIRVTTGDGFTEVPFELVTIDTVAKTGEIHFRAALDSTTDTTFYVYHGNPSATAYATTATYGRNNVWSNGYVAVYHMDQDPSLGAPQYIDSTGSTTGTAFNMETGDQQAAQVGRGADLDGTNEYIGTNMNRTLATSTWSLWMRTDGNQGAYDGVLFSRGGQTSGINIDNTANRIGYHWNDAAATYNWNGGPVYPRNTWFMASLVVLPNQATAYVHATSGITSGVNVTTHGNSLINALNFGQDSAGGRFYNGLLDEVRISNTARTQGWLTTSFNNMASTTQFYAVSASEAQFTRTFADTNATVLGNLILDTGGDSTFNTGTLSVGGSFTNNAQFNANNGTVRFNSTAGSETIDAGDSSFATVTFDSVTGDFTITENATATVAVNLTNVSQFTLSSGRVLATQGTFTNAVSGTNTTWTGSTLRLLSATTTNMNAKTHGGDVYGTLEAASSTLAKMWNSSATSYVTSGAAGAIYSQDHAAVDGDLYIFGNYIRSTGTEYWSYGTDFDGTALIASTSRQVDVRIATSSQIGLTNASLNLVGIASASTTIDALSGTFSLNATNTTVTAEHFRVAGTNAEGFGLKASSTLSVFRDGLFTVAPSRTGITVDASTIDTNPTVQYYRVGFATTSPGAASNITLQGSPSSFIWFREGTGGLYGEAFDNNDSNPGSIRFDDSSNTVTISGVVYADAGLTTLGGPTCDGSTQNVRVVVDGGTYASSTSCNGTTGAYSFPAVAYTGDPKVVVYLDTNGGVQGSVITKTPTGNITNMHIYANRVITRHQDVSPLTIADLQSYDFDNDTDLRFVAATGTLTVLANTELFVFASSTFAPGGNVTLTGNGNANSYEGTLQIGANATFTASGTQTHTLAGRFVMATTSTFTSASSTFIFNATTTGKSITSPNLVTFNQLQFAGTGGGWNITAPISVVADMNIASGTVTGTNNITIQNGSLYGNGILSLGSGTTTINRTNTLGGTSAWTFSNLILGNGSVVGTTTPASAATTTVSGTLTIANAHFLDAGNAVFDLSGTGNVLVRTGTFLEDTSTLRFSGATANVPSINYYNLVLNAGAGSATYTGTGSGILVYNDLIIGGSATSTFTANTSDPVVEVRGDVVIQNNGTLQASNSANLTILGDYTNLGTFVGNSGTVRFTGSTTSLINAGSSSFSNVVIDGTGTFSLNSHATATNAFTLTNHSAFNVNNGQTLSVGGQFTNTLGGAATNWGTSTLLLTGSGTYSINASTTNDVYNNLAIAAGTQIRMWNSSASSYAVNATGSLYSQDHAGVNGDAYIWGQLVRTTGNDYWSYSTDFDGTNLTGGSERQAEIYFASGASALWAGGSIVAVGTPSATTTIQNQGSGTYGITFGTGSTVQFDTVQVRDTNSNGVVFAGAPTVTDFSRTDHLVGINSGSAITVGGTVINANEAKNFTNNKFEAGGGVTGAKNVTATGTTISSWRFTNHLGNISGEAFDDDPAGDPGYVVWDDSAALITVAGNVYSDEGVTVSTVCDGSTNNIRLVVAGLTTYNTSCNAGTGAYSISGVAFSPLDTLTLFINGETPKATTVSVAPISSISNMHLYHNRVVVRHENTDPITIANMAVWDSSFDSDINFTATTTGTDTLTLPADTKLLIWTGKTFEPNGNVTLAGAGAGAAYDGTLEAQTNARFRAKTTEAHSIGGSVIFGTGAEFVGASSTLTLTTTGASRTFDVNSAALHNLTVSGSGSYVVTDATLTLGGSYTQSNGAVTFGSGTTTIGASFNVTSGSFTNGGSPFVFTSTSGGNTVRFNNSVVSSLRFTNSGSFTMSDTNATSTGSVLITGSTVTLPSGNFAIGGSFEKRSGTVTHNTSDLIMTATSTAVLTASSSDLYAVRFVGPAAFTITDANITFLDSFTIASGSVALGASTTAVGGSFVATGGTFASASGTVLLNSASAGLTVNPGTSPFYNLQFGAPSGGYTLFSATTTNNLTIASANILTVNPTAVITVGGVFTNSVGGAGTTWTNTTLRLISQSGYSINTRSNSGDVYGTISIDANTDIRSWYSSAATTTVALSGSLYSQDHANTNGALYVYGDLQIATTTEYWNYSNDFDGTVLSGSNQRKVTVSFAPNATTTVTTGSLQIVGTSGSSTIMQNQGSGTYNFAVTGGTLNANYYEFGDMNVFGLQLSGLSTIDELSNGYFDIAVASGSAVTLSSTTLNANPSKTFDAVGFNATGPLTGYNINLTGETANAWRFTNNYGNIGGEGFDIDGIDACGSIRFDNSSCLLTEQTHVRWRNDDGGEGAPSTEWFNSSFDYRTRVRVLNNDNQAYASTAVKVIVPYDSSMQSDFEDIRFTSDNGQTQIPFWIERYTASTDAQIWVRVPTLPASDYATVFMYYGSSTAVSQSSGTSTMNAFDDYEDASISEYSGDTSLFTTVTTPVYGGARSLAPSNPSGKTTDGIFRFDDPVTQGEIIRYMQYVNTSGGSGDEPCTLFGVQSPGTTNQNYGVCLEQFGVDRISLARDVDNNDTSGVVLATTTVTYTTGWYEVEIDWQTSDLMEVSLFNSAGTLIATTSATDANYTSGGFGYAFWFQNGAWDSFTSRARIATTPTVFLGAKQTDGGASWASSLDGITTAIPGDIVRLRLAVENSGLDVTAQQYRLEFAAKGAAPTCESVNSASYATVPNQASCGSSPVCMQASTFVTNGDPATDLLTGTEGTFSEGSIVESPSSQTAATDLDQDFYTELEYVLTPTSNASDDYCFRVTNDGTPLDFYAKIAELGLQFDPTFGAVTLNGGGDINLTPGTTTPVTVSGIVTDFNGASDIIHATATIYRSGAGPTCTPDNNNCYVATTENGQCTLTNCVGNSCDLSCEVDIFFHADATDEEPYLGQTWEAYAEAEDSSEGYDFASAIGVELITLRAMAVDSVINYGALSGDSDTGSFNPTTTITNLGNTPINVDVEGTDLTDGESSAIPADQQKVATSTFTYNACVTCQQLSSSSAVVLGLNLSKPSVVTPPVETDVYWGIAVPFTASNAAHTGTNIFTAIGID